MQASTHSMCLRKLSDLVYSHSNPHADSRFIMDLYLYSPYIRLLLVILFLFCLKFSIDKARTMPETTASFRGPQNCATFWSQPALALLNLHGYNISTGGFPGSGPLRPMSPRPIPDQQQSLPKMPHF